jgi:hypothetical protein
MSRTSNSIAMINTRLNTNGCALSSRNVFSSAPLFFSMKDMEFRVSASFIFFTINKGALLGIFELLRAQLLVRRHLSIIATLFWGIRNLLFTQNEQSKNRPLRRHCVINVTLLSTIHYPLSTINYPLSTIHYQLFTINY